MNNEIETEGLWAKLQRAKVESIKPELTLEELKQMMTDLFNQPYKRNKMCLPTYYLLTISDEEFIRMHTEDMTEFNKNYYFMGGSEANRLVQERKAKLLPNE